VSTIRVIFSVTDLKVWPCPMTRNSPVDGSIQGRRFFTSLVAILASSLLTLSPANVPPAHLEVRSLDSTPRPHTSSRTSIQIGEHLVTALIGLEFRHLALFVVDIAKVIAEAGQACWQAAHTSAPSRMGRFSLSPLSGRRDALHAVNCTSPSLRASAP